MVNPFVDIICFDTKILKIIYDNYINGCSVNHILQILQLNEIHDINEREINIIDQINELI
jgi:hypothetical protein